MTKRNDQERLLDDVLTGEVESGFREASLENVLQLARQRRQTRTVRRGGVIAAVLFASAIGVMRYFGPKQATPEIAQANPPATSFARITSQPLPTTELVTSHPLSPEQIVSHLHMPNVVHTVPGNYREVGDDDLLALAAPQIVALVRRGPHEAELIFVPPPTNTREN